MNPLLINSLTPYIMLSIAVVLDLAYPYHKGIALRTHPVHTSYFLGKRLVKSYSSRLYGVILWFTVISAHIAPLIILQYFLSLYWGPNPIIQAIYIVIFSYILKVSFSLRLLISSGLKVYRSSLSGEWDEVHKVVQGLVRRRVSDLNNDLVLSACIESLAESLVDGFVSPLFYFPFFGPIGSLIQRVSNTLDGLVGFKTPELIDIGWFSAKADTVLNYLPARLTALYIIISSALLHLDWRTGLKTWLRDRRRTESVNAGNPMSAIAGCLKVRLIKPGHYRLGDEGWGFPQPHNVLEAVKVVVVSAMIHLTFVATLIFIVNSLI